MKNKTECSYCDGLASVFVRKAERKLRGELFEVFEHYYKCNKCGYQFTTDEIDTFDEEQVYNLYREKHGIPSPVQISNLKENYKVNYNDLAEILGFGVNVYSKYENGELPSATNGKVLQMVLNPVHFLTYVKESADFKNKNKIIHHLNNLIENETGKKDEFHFLYDDKMPNQYNGFSLPSFEKFGNMVLFFIDLAPFKVRLNKLLFYADFLHFKYSGCSISGWKYKALPMGVVPANYLTSYDLLIKENYLDTVVITKEEEFFDKFIGSKKFDRNIFSDSEMETLVFVKEKFGYLKLNDIVHLNHEEDAWIHENEARGFVSYPKYAFQIKADEINSGAF